MATFAGEIAMNRFGRSLAWLLALVVCGVAAAHAQTGYPDHPVKIIVPIGPGGSYDLVGRHLADALSKRMGQAFVVENKPGAGTVVGTQAASQSEPDGYTLVVGGLSNMAFNSALYSKLGYDPRKDFAPIGLAVFNSTMLVVSTSMNVNSAGELAGLARENPGKITIAITALGSVSHLGLELFQSSTGVKFQQIPYRGASQAMTDLLGGQLNGLFGDGPTVIGLWAFDGTNARPIAPRLMANEDDPNSSSFTSFNGALYFRASEGYGGTMELWKFDGNSVVRAPGIAAGTLAIASGMKVYDGALYFGASEPPSSSNYELWKYDGSQATLATEIRPGADGSYPGGFEIHEGSLYFRANGDEFGDQLWRYNSSTGVAERVTSNLATGPAILASLAGVLYIWTTPSPSAPARLWSYNGVQATPLADFVNASSVFRFKGTLYFGADDGVHGFELWKLGPDVLAGDLNRDGNVSIADFITLSSNFGKTNAGWSQGDLNYDGEVTVSDFIDLAANFNGTSTAVGGTGGNAQGVANAANGAIGGAA